MESEPQLHLQKPHPGETLREDFLMPMNLTAYKLSKSIGVPYRRVAEILKGKRSITVDMAHRLAQFFGTSEELWLGLQSLYDLEEVLAQKRDI